MPVPLYVLIPTHSRPELLRRTLHSLAECRLPDGFAGTIVIENGGRLGAAAVVKSAAPKIKASYLYTPVGNKSHALNIALEQLDNGMIYFTDDDVRFHPDVLLHYAHAAIKHGPAYFFGGPIGVDYEQTPPVWLLRSLPASAKGWSSSSESPRSDLVFLGCNWAAFLAQLRKAGGFTEDRGPGLGMTGQEADMQRRLMLLGYGSRYVQNAWVWHYVPWDRCSPDWAIERNRRAARAWGRNYSDRASAWAVLLRRLRWTLEPRHAIWWLISQITRSDVARHRAKLWDARRTGVFQGIREQMAARKCPE